MPVTVFTNATLVMPDRLVPHASLAVDDGRIAEVGAARAGRAKYGP